MCSRISLVSAILLCSSATALAQHPDESSQFYPRHFVTETLRSSEERTPNTVVPMQSPAMTPKAASTQVAPGRSLGLEGGAVEVIKDEIKSDSKDLMAAANSPGLVVTALSVIVSTANHEHFLQAIEQFNSIMSSRNLQPGTLYMIGPAINPVDLFQSGNVLGPLLSRGGLPMSLFEIPKKYDVKASPTWIIETESGEILLEAVPSLEKYFNAKGEFIDPSKNMPVLKVASRERK